MGKKFRALCMAAVLGACASAYHAPLANVQPVSIPDFDSERGIQWSSSRAEFDTALADQRFIMEQFTYPSDGLTVGAYLYRPRTPPARPAPVIVYNRGSYMRPDGFAAEMLVMANRFARAGFIVVAPQLRGSNGWEGRDEMGGADLNDIMNIAPQIAKIEGADPSRIFLAGESRGGAMTYMALREGFPARAAAVWGAFTDLESMIGLGGRQERIAGLIWPDIEQNRAAIVESRSAIRWAHRITAPILIMHGAQDEDIDLAQSQRMDAELTRLAKTHEFVVFEGEQHRIGGRGAERDAAAVAWFRRFGA